MTRTWLHFLATALLLVSCNRAPESKEAVRVAVMDHLAKNTGLDISSMTVDVGDVKFENDKAVAAVSFRPKSSPDAGMTMNYSLERRGGKWVVAKPPEGSGHGGGMAAPAPQPGTEMPSGHPPVGATDKGGASAELPAGHPPVSRPDTPKK